MDSTKKSFIHSGKLWRRTWHLFHSRYTGDIDVLWCSEKAKCPRKNQSLIWCVLLTNWNWNKDRLIYTRNTKIYTEFVKISENRSKTVKYYELHARRLEECIQAAPQTLPWTWRFGSRSFLPNRTRGVLEPCAEPTFHSPPESTPCGL